MSTRLRLGLIGAGPWGRNCIRTITALTGLALTKVASRNRETERLVPPGCVVMAHWADVVDAEDVDAVIVASPPKTHAEISLAAIEAGRPVLVEKPLTIDAGSAERVVEAARRRSVLVMVDHVHLFHPAFRELKRQATQRGVKVRAIRARAGGPPRADVPALWDWGPHDVAMCIDLVGAAPQSVTARLLERRAIGEADGERLELELRFANDVIAQIELSTLGDRHRSFEVDLGSGTLRYDATPPEAFEDLPLTRAVAEFAQAVRHGKQTAEGAEFGLAVVRTLERCAAQLA